MTSFSMRSSRIGLACGLTGSHRSLLLLLSPASALALAPDAAQLANDYKGEGEVKRGRTDDQLLDAELPHRVSGGGLSVGHDGCL
jgi:hypothetical protein